GRFLTGLALFALYSAGLVFFWRRKSPLFIPLALILAAFSIFSNSFVLSSIIFAERILYLPLAFFTVFLGGFVFQVYQTMISGAAKTIIALFFFTICVVFALIAINRSYDWSDEFRLYKSSLVARPDSARLSVNIGKILMERNDFAKAKAFLTRSVDIDPECAEAHNNLSLIAMRAGDFKTTYSHLKKALEINPQNGKAWNNLCGFFISQGRFQEACEACKRALSLGVRTMHYDALMLDGLCR
ncbi:MAG: tetratricopeptide repeat protein, partial [Deltaproteobacteria bacterium]|nr:tetratricopeptide repeat protein [Deltaproteobacteria bacterium]